MKNVFLFSLAALFSDTSAWAGGTMGGNPGDISQMKPLLEASWNGSAGIQTSQSYGVIVQWSADVCGTLNGKELDNKNCLPKEIKVKP